MAPGPEVPLGFVVFFGLKLFHTLACVVPAGMDFEGNLFDSNSSNGLFAWNPHLFFQLVHSLQTHRALAKPEAVSGREVGAICEAVCFLDI